MLLFLTLVGSVSLALWDTFNARYAILGTKNACGWGTTFLLGGSYLVVSLFLGVVWLVLLALKLAHWPTNPLFWFSLLTTVAINIFFETLRFKAYTLAPLSLTSPFAAVSPIITIVTAKVFFGEFPTFGATLGIILIVCSIYFVNIQEKISWRTALKPFKNIWQNDGVRLAFLSSIPPAVSIIFDKQAVAAADPFSFSFLAQLLIGIGALVLVFLNGGSKKFVSQVQEFPWQKIFVTSSLLCIAVVAFNITFLFTAVANISALRRVVVLFEIVFGYIILRQRDQIKRRLLAGAGIVAGAMLISIFH